jgi:hypothetical protein
MTSQLSCTRRLRNTAGSLARSRLSCRARRFGECARRPCVACVAFPPHVVVKGTQRSPFFRISILRSRSERELGRNRNWPTPTIHVLRHHHLPTTLQSRRQVYPTSPDGDDVRTYGSGFRGTLAGRRGRRRRCLRRTRCQSFGFREGG